MNRMEPVDEEIWAPILADPLDWPPSSHTIPLPSQVEEYVSYVYNNYAMEINQFVEEAPNKTWWDQYFGELITKEYWKRGPRASRKRRIIPSNPPCLCNVPSESGNGKWCGRKNNPHWSVKEVIKLVEGVEKYGVGSWTKVKHNLFSGSVRNPTHLKDKWRNLLRSCGIPCNSERKKKPQQRRFFPIDATLINRIQGAAS